MKWVRLLVRIVNIAVAVLVLVLARTSGTNPFVAFSTAKIFLYISLKDVLPAFFARPKS
jgi:hypothetical protein